MVDFTEEDLKVLSSILPSYNFHRSIHIFRNFVYNEPCRPWPVDLPFNEIPLHMDLRNPTGDTPRFWTKIIFEWRLRIGK